MIIPTISGEGTVLSAITCGFSKYLAWWEQKEVRGNRGAFQKGEEENGTVLSVKSSIESLPNTSSLHAKPPAAEVVLTTTLGRSL